MAVIKYFAKRSLASGHSAGTEYSIEIGFTQYESNRKRQINESKSLSGRTFTTLHRVDLSYQIQTVPTDNATTIEQLIEFMASVEGGETFQIDEKGTIASPDAFYSFKLKGDFKTPRVGRKDRFSISFEVQG